MSYRMVTALILLLCLATMCHAGTWLSFNDFEDGMGEPSPRFGDMVTYCKETQKRLAKRAILGERTIRAQQDNVAFCKMLARMGR